MIPYQGYNFHPFLPFPFFTETFAFIVASIIYSIVLIALFEKEKMIDIRSGIRFVFGLFIFSYLGGRLFHFLLIWDGWLTMFDFFDVRNPGLVSFGMIFGGFLYLVFYSMRGSSKKSVSGISEFVNKPMGLVVIPTGLWVFVYRSIGCFLYGDAIGTATDLPWGVVVGGVSTHPLALYLALNGLLIFVIMLFLYQMLRETVHPWVFSILFLFLYLIGRGAIEVLRMQSIFGHMAPYFILFLVIALALAIFHARYERRNIFLKSN